MVYVLINLSGQRIKMLDGTITPAFDYPAQAFKFAENHGMKCCRIIKV